MYTFYGVPSCIKRVQCIMMLRRCTQIWKINVAVTRCRLCLYVGVYAALWHGYSHLLAGSSPSSDNVSASSVRLDSPWFAARGSGQSSCRVQFAVSSDVRLSSSSPLPLELLLRSDADNDEVVVWTSPANWNPTPRSVVTVIMTTMKMITIIMATTRTTTK